MNRIPSSLRTAKAVLVLIGCCLAASAPTWALLTPEQPAGPRVYVRTMWNDEYLLLAAQVEDTMLTGSNEEPLSSPWNDDDVEFFFEVPQPAGPPLAHRLAISVAGGFTLLTRQQGGDWRADPAWITGERILKFGVKTDGTLNDPTDLDRGFSVEVAIPWRFLGGVPTGPRAYRFNVACFVRGENETFVTWSPQVKAEEDLADPGRWGELIISPGIAPREATSEAFISSRTARWPLIEGTIQATEWMTASTLQLVKPPPALAPQPALARGSEEPLVVLASYHYGYDGGPEPAPATRIWREGGLTLLADQPREGVGPWLSGLRPQWHFDQLREIRRAGIDALLVAYPGEEAERERWGREGLLCLVQALKEMRNQDESYPLVGLRLDFAGLKRSLGRELDLTREPDKQAIYSIIKEFFRRLPPQFRAEMGRPPESRQPPRYPVLLDDASLVAKWDPGFLSFCEQAFARDFGGAGLTWMGPPSWKREGVRLYCYLSLDPAAGLRHDDAGLVAGASISPGCEPGAGGPGRARAAGQAYRSDWQRLLLLRPRVVLINSWNDFRLASEVAPSRQYGFQYADLTRLFAARLGSRPPSQLQLKKQTLPSVLLPGADYQVELLLKNVGATELRTGAKISVEYELFPHGENKPVAAKSGAQELRLLPGQSRRVPVLISTRNEKGEPLPPGDYEFHFTVARAAIPYLHSSFALTQLARITLPLRVGQVPARRAFLLESGLPTRLQAGKSYDVLLLLRNDGSRPWSPRDTRVSYHWLRDSPAEEPEVVEWQGRRSPLPREVAPGEVVAVSARVDAATAAGLPLPLEGGPLLLRWDLVQGEEGWFNRDGAPLHEETVNLIASEQAVDFEETAGPGTMTAAASAPVRLKLKNPGPETWKPGDWVISWAWYYLDGQPAPFPGGKLPLPHEVRPGEGTVLEASPQAPPVGGGYWLAWQLGPGGQASPSPAASRGKDMLVLPVAVEGGRFHYLPLDKELDVVAATSGSRGGLGNFDGGGASLPIEFLPPDLSRAPADSYPCGYYQSEGSRPPREVCPRVPFQFPAKKGDTAGALACRGQVLALPGLRLARIHLLGAATGREQGGPAQREWAVTYQTGAPERTELAFSRWLDQPAEGEHIAFTFPLLRLARGDDRTRRPALFHRQLETDPSRPATGLRLPDNPQFKLLAITLEAAEE